MDIRKSNVVHAYANVFLNNCLNTTLILAFSNKIFNLIIILL